MKLGEWIATLRAAARPMDTLMLYDGAHQIAQRATELTRGQVSFTVMEKIGGVTISANPPSVLAARALRRATEEHLGSIQGAVATQGRERLIDGA